MKKEENKQENKQISDRFTTYQKIVMLSLAFIQFTIILDFMIIAPIGDILMKTLSISTEQFGFVVSSYAFSAAVSGIAVAGFVDKYDRKKVLLVFFTGFIIGTLLCGLSTTYVEILASRIITGIFAGVQLSYFYHHRRSICTAAARSRDEWRANGICGESNPRHTLRHFHQQ